MRRSRALRGRVWESRSPAPAASSRTVLAALVQRRAAAELDRGDYQPDLSISYGRLGDLLRARRGRAGPRALHAGPRDRRATGCREPDHVDYQQDLAISRA